ncbi:MAG: tetratricopeptide repeat protein [Verrucomicrobiia bacterium]
MGETTYPSPGLSPKGRGVGLFRSISPRVVAALLALVTILSLWVFRPVLANGFVDWDDHIYLGELARMGRFSWSSLRWMWTSLEPFYLQPIAWMTHLADYQIWGLNPIGHHATNWVLHGVYVALVGTLVWLLTGKAGNVRPMERLAMSVLIALVCGIHPLQVESVAWVAARNGLLCSLWMVAALCAYVRAVGPSPRRSGFVRAGGDDGGLNPGWRPARGWWWTVLVLDAVALLTKPIAVSLPVVMLAVDYFPLRRYQGRGVWRLVAEKWVVIALSAAVSVGAIGARQQLEGLAENALTTRLLVAARGVVFYLWKLVWPSWLSPFYPLSDSVSLRSVEFLVPVLFCVGVTVVAVWGRKRMPVLLAAWVSYLALLLPMCGLVQVGGQAVADRYAYLPMVPVLLAFVAGILWMWRRGPVGVKVAFCVTLGVWFMFLGSRTREQIAVWHDDISLWSAALEHFPDDPHSNYDLGLALLKAHRLEEARVAVERAVTHSDPHAIQLPMARGALGVIYLKTHEYNQAIVQLQQAIAADGALWAARYNLACAYARTGRLAEAYDVLQALLAKQPQYASLAVRDGELAALRDDPEYGARLTALIGAAKN